MSGSQVSTIIDQDVNAVLQRTGDLWEEMRGSRLFLTGGTGFFGRWLLESLLAANRAGGLSIQATVLTRNPETFRQSCPHLALDSAITLWGGDVRDFRFPSGEFRYVIHAATDTWMRQETGGSVGLLETILGGTERALQFASTHGTQKFLLTSSGAVYGPQPPAITHLSEEYSGAPNPLLVESAYAEGKRAAEALCTVYGDHYSMACKIARCFAFVGPYFPLDQHFAIGSFIQDALQGREIHVHGDGTPRRSYMYAADLARWLWTILLRAPAHQAYNVGSGESISIEELACTVQRTLGCAAGVKIAKKAIEGAPVLQYVPCIQKAELHLGLRCDVTLEEGIRRTAQSHGWSASCRS